MTLFDKIKKLQLGMTKKQVKAVLGEPSDISVDNNVFLYGGHVGGYSGNCNKPHYELAFFPKIGLWYVMKMPEHSTVMTAAPETAEQKRLRAEWVKEDALENLSVKEVIRCIKKMSDAERAAVLEAFK